MARKKQKNSYQTADEWMGRQSGGSTPGGGGTQSYGGMQTADEWMGANVGSELTLKGQAALQANQLYQRLQDAAQVRARKTLAGYLGSGTSQVLGYVTDGINRGWQAGSTDRVNQAVNDYKEQVATGKDAAAQRRSLESQRSRVEMLRASGSIGEAEYQEMLAPITKKLAELEAVPSKPKRPTLDAKEWANEQDPSGKSTEQEALWQQAARAQERKDRAQANWDEAQRGAESGLPPLLSDKRRYDQAVDQYDELMGQLNGKNEAEKKKKALEAEREKEQQELEEAEAALPQLEEDFYRVPDGDFDGVRARYLAGEDRITDAQQRIKALGSEIKALEQVAPLEKLDNEALNYEVYRRRRDFDTTVKKAMQAGLDKQDDPVSWYLANQEALDASADSETPLQRWHWLSDNEIAMYYYVLGKQGQDEAEKYLDTISIRLDKRISDYTQALTEMRYGTAGTAGKIGMNALSVPASVAGGIASAVTDVGEALTGNFSPYSSGHSVSNYANTVRGVTARDITENVKDPFWQTVWQNTYYAGMSALDSAMGAALFGKGYTAIMGASSASQRARELYEDGASGEQIALGALASGAIEIATEKYSIEYFTSNFLKGDIKGFTDWMKKTLIQGATEMSEEVASELANQVVDALLRGANSDNNQEIQEMIAQGIPEEKAKRQALVNRAVDVFWAGYGGFVSGAAMGGVGGAIDKGIQNAQYKADGARIIQNEGIQALIDQAKGLDVNEKLLAIANDRATRTLEQLQSENLIRRGQTQKALGQLYSQVTRAQAQGLESTARADVRQAAEQALAGQVENPQAAAEAATKAAFGEALTEQEQQAVEAAGGENFVARLQDTARSATDTWLRTVGLAAEEGHRMNPKTLAQQRGIVQEAAQEFSDPAAMVSAYRDGQDPALFIRGWKAAYANGRNGVAVKYSLDSRLTSRTGMSRGQIIAAHEAGRKAAGYGSTQTQTAENAAAAGDVWQGQEWNDMRNPGRKNGAVAEGAGAGAAGGQEAGGGADGAAAGGKVSARGLGIRNGTAEENLTVRPREQYTKAEKAAAEVAAKHGLEITIVQGGSIKTVEQVDGKDVLTKSRALIVGDKMIVRSDDPLFSPAQIARHEAAHKQLENGELSLGTAVRQLQQRYSTAQIREMIRLYTAAYGNTGMNARQVLEEMVCDAMGKMNAFATEETSTVAGEVGQFLRDLRKTALETRTEGQKNNAQEGVKYSIQNTQNMSWEDQIKGALYGEKNIRRNDTLVVGDVAAELVQDGVTQKPLAIPLSVMTKASNGKDISHSIKKGKLANLDSGIKNAPIVIVNPSRNAIVYVTNIKQGGAPILAAFDMNAVFDGDEVHKATSIHLQINVQSMLDNLPQSATVYVQNENELAAVGATNNLRGLAANVKFISDGSIANRGENVKQKYSRELDSEYMELAKDPEGNREKISRMVAEAARAAGYDSPLLYHGTQSFGFTQFDLSKMDDGQSIFLTSNPDIASTYSGVGGKRDISNASRTDVSKLSIQEVAKMLNQFPPESGSDYSYSYVSSKADIEKQVDSGIAKLNGMIPALKSKYAEDSSEISKLNHLRNLLFLGDRSSIATALWTISRKFDIFDGNEDFINNLEQNIRLLGKAPSTGGFVVEKFLGGYSIKVLNDAEAREALQKNMQRGNYGLYAKLGNFLTVDGNGNYWNDLKNWAKAMEVDEKNTYVMEDNGWFYLLRTTDDSVVENGFVSATKQARALSQESLHFLLIQKANTSLRILAERTTTTRGVAKWAKNTGYDSVIFKDIKDSGGQNDNVGLDTTADVYVIFNPNDAKSADAVTYDDNGKVIPLSERFNSDKRDIRYSRELELDSEGNALTQEQADFFADSEVRNDDGELIPVYHKTTESFTVFQRGKLGKETLGNADDASLAATSLIGHWFSDSENTPFMGNAMKTYLNIKNPYYTSLDELAADMGDFSGDLEMMQDHFDRGQYNMVREAARSYVRWMKWKGYDGLIVNDTETGGTSYVILNSNQAKLTDNGNPTSKRDIRYSRELETVEALKRQNEILQKQRDYWKEQTRTTDEKTRGADKGEVRSLAGQLIRQYSSKTEVEEILPEMQWLADSIWRNDPKISYTDLQDSAQNIARMVLDGSEVNLNAENWETGQELKRFLRGRYINVDESLKEDIGDFKNFKRSNRSLHFRENGTGTGVASLWLELQNDFGKGLFPDSVSNPGDQIRHIADTLTSLTESDMRNPYAADMELTVEQMAYDVMARAAGLNRQKATRADQAVERATEELNRLLKAGRTRERARIEQSQQTTYRQQIKNVSEKFQRMLLRPGKGATQHAPANLVGAVRSFCELFNDSEMRRAARWQLTLEERSAALAEQAARDYVPKGAAEEARKIGTSQERLDRMTARLADLQKAYSSLAKGEYQNAYDDTVQGMIDSMAGALAGKDIYQLDTNDLLKVKNTMTALLHTVSEANNAYSMGRDKTVSGMAQKMASEMRQVNHQMPGLRSMAGRYWMWQKTPDVFFNYMCGYIKDNEGKVVQKAFQRGSEKMFGVQREFYQMFQEFTEGSKETQKELRKLMNDPKKNLVSWGLKDRGGNEVQTSRGMMMQAYMLLRQHDSFESLQFGGFSLPNTEEYYKGNVRGAYGNMDESEMVSEALGSGYSEIAHEQGEIREQIEELRQQMKALSPADAQAVQEQIDGLEQQRKENQKQLEDMAFAAAEKLGKLRQTIEEQLTPLEKQLIDRATEWYAHTGKLMKDVFLEMYGYAPNLVDNYVPIHRDPATIKTDIRDMAGAEKAFNLENSSFTIDRVKNYQPILLTDFFQELEGQKEKMSRYVGFAQVQKDFGKLWKTRIGSSDMTINKLVEAKFGSGRTKFGVSGTDFVEHYIADIAGGHSSEDILGDFYGHYAAATLRFNPRVAVSQAASIPTAAAVVGWKSAAVGFAKGLPNAMSTKYRNELAAKNVWFWQRYRGQGGSTELADIRQKGGVIEKIANSNVGKKLFNWCQAVDVFSTGSFMWCMAEDYVQRTQGLKPGMEGYESAVNETYTDIIRKSQPNYTTTERSDLLRDKRAHMKMLTMFKTQSSQNLNLLMEANGEFMRARLDLKNGANGVTEADVKAARAKLANAATGVFLGGTVAFVGLRTIMNFIMGAVNPYRDEETDEVTPGGVIKGMSKEVLSSLAGTIALGGQVYDLVMSVVSGDKYYGMSDSALTTITELVENSQKVIANALDTDKEITPNQIWNMANSWCQALGIPASNAKKLYNMIDMYIRDIRNGTFGQYTSSYTSKDQYRARVAQGVIAGETGAADDALAMLFAQSTKDNDEDIQKDIAAGMREYLKKAYMTADVTDLEAERILEYTGTEDPAAVVARWDFMLEKPEVDNVSDNLVAAYNGRGDLDGDLVIEAYKYKGQHTKEEVVKYIQSLEITAAQKRALWDLIKGNWKGKDTPWG